MVKKNNRICYVCQKKYTFCGSCSQYANLPKWKAMFDTENCKNIWDTLSDFETGYISEERAKEIMSKLDTSMKDSYIGCVKKSYDKLYGIKEQEESVKHESVKNAEPVKQADEPVEKKHEEKHEKAKVTRDKNYGGKVVFDPDKANKFNAVTKLSENK